MKSADLHPEDLIDKRSRGALSPVEDAILQEHLDRCAVCRFELAARDELALEDSGEPSDAEVAAAIAGALGAVRTAPKPAPEELTPAPVAVPNRRRRLAGLLLVAAALMVGGVATARLSGGWTALVTGLGTAEPTRRTLVSGAEETATPTPTLTPTLTPALTLTPTPALTPTLTLTPAPAPAPTPALTLTPTPTLALTGAVTAAALFARASDARQRGDHAGAGDAYRELLAKHPDAAEAPIARVAFGRMLLDDGDATHALEMFEAYLRGADGVLREEAMLGRAVALQRLGRTQEEADAWTALLGAVPGSVHAERARARLEELGRR
jgi:TolA-binding protein